MSRTLTNLAGRRVRRLVPGRRSPAPACWAEESLTWVYAITGELSPGQLTGLAGVGGGPVRAIAESGLHAVVGDVSAESFGDKALADLLADLASAERIGRVHHQVIACVAADGPVLPLRLGAVYPGDDTVRALLARRRGEFEVLLESFRGTEEWGIKVYAEDGEHPRAAQAALRLETGGDEGIGPAMTSADTIDRALSGIAIARRHYPAAVPRAVSGPGAMVLNCAYLLRQDRAAEFTTVAKALDRVAAGIRTDLTGPWPPYSFAEPQGA
jgi:Gas vesicle synthesis protein GvpL/GvpF